MSSRMLESTLKLFTPETLFSAARQSFKIHIVPVRLRRAIKNFIREEDEPDIKKKVLRLAASFNKIKNVNLLTASTSKELVENPMKEVGCSKRWKIRSSYGDIGLRYDQGETVAYVAARMPAVYSACYRVLKEVQRRLPGFCPAEVLDYGAGAGSALWAVREVWPTHALQRLNIIEPSKAMQRTGQKLIQGLKGLPLIHSYDSIRSLSENVPKAERKHDLVIASYVLGEIPSVTDRITTVRQLWGMTRDILVLVEPGTPHGFEIVSQMRSHILWLEKRKCRKTGVKDAGNGAFIVAPCPHDGTCPLRNTGRYCHFAQRIERTTVQHAYKRSNGRPLRGFEDEKFSFVVFRRGDRPAEAWPLDGMSFESLKERHARRRPEDLEIDLEDLLPREEGQRRVADPADYDSDVEEEGEGETVGSGGVAADEGRGAGVGSGWGRILFMPIRRGKRVTMDVCCSTRRDGSEGSFQRLVISQTDNPTLHRQARKSLWGDLWPF